MQGSRRVAAYILDVSLAVVPPRRQVTPWMEGLQTTSSPKSIALLRPEGTSNSALKWIELMFSYGHS